MKLALNLSACAFALAAVATAPVYAQSQSEAADQVDETVDSNVIVVTAQGRAQVLSDVPVAISAINSEQLQKSGATDIRELNQLAPSLLVSSTGNEANGSARIRGIGTVGDNPGLESSVAVFIDGVYRSRSGNALSELGPIERVEILRGPQGTLGGRNSSAGMISITTAGPEFNFGGHASVSYGNYDQLRIEGGVTGPLSDTIAARIDGVYLKRDGFYTDVVNGTDINNKDRYIVRGQLLFEPNDGLSIRVIGDYSKKDESCCAATFVQPEFAQQARISPGLDPFALPLAGSPGLTNAANPIIPVLLALGQNSNALTQSTFNRDIYATAGRSYAGETEDFGASVEINAELGNMNLTSITGYREYSNFQASDTDYTQVDILYREPNENAGAREFKTFTQELRLQGSAFDDKLDWLIGGFYANEKLETRDNIRFGTQYGAFAPCRIVNAVNPALASPTSTGCLSAGGRAALAGAFGAATPLIFAGLDNLATINDRGTVLDVYNQKSENFAFFTHNIFHISDKLDLTLGLRYTNETKDFNAAFTNDNTMCPTQRALFTPLLGGPLGGLAAGLIGLSCQGNSTSELDGVTLSDSRSENEFTGTAILSYKPTEDLLLYGSYSRGYKAGGFNLDRSALTSSTLANPALTGDTANLQFDQETVDAFEIGAKYSTREFSLSVAAFRQQFQNFQLNTFNGSVFLVQNINGCSDDLGGADMDADGTTGNCAADNVKYGVVAQGVELEASINPVSYVNISMGLTYTDTSYENDLVGRDTGTALDPALRLLPGDNLSNAPEITATASLSYTPPLGNSGLTGLFYVNARTTSDYNTGSDLLYGKEQDGFTLVNARIGVRGPDDKWAIEGWAQNLFNINYSQVAFNTPFVASQQTYSAFLAEPRTYGITLRGQF